MTISTRDIVLACAAADRAALAAGKPRPGLPAGLDLRGADLRDADLSDADLSRANLSFANLRSANLRSANLRSADLSRADLSRANLSRADLSDADLSRANLSFANLSDATMPDGRTWEAYRADHMAGLCDDPEVRAKAVAAWGKHSWSDCPMHAAHGWRSTADAGDRAAACALWVALYDSEQLPRPEGGA